MNNTPFLGLIAAPHTPFTSDGALNPSVIARQAEHLRANGVNGAFVCGTTGEGASLSVTERMQVAESWIAARRDGLRVLVHVGHNALPDAITLARHARTIRADAIAALAPHFFRPATIADLLAYLEPIAAAAPETPFFYYHIPAFTGVDLPIGPIFEQAVARIPTFRGIKFSQPDFTELQMLLGLMGDKYDVLWGCDDVLLGALTFGVRGAVGSTYNHSAPLYLKMWDAFSAGDFATARGLSRQAVAMIHAMREYGVIPAQKALLDRIGVPLGPPRVPLTPVSPEKAGTLLERFQAEGWLTGTTVRP